MKLRPYQQAAVDHIHEQFKANSSVLISLATGLGKTVVFSYVCDEYMKKGRVLVVAHREELITQASGKLEIITGNEPDVEMGENWAKETHDIFKNKIIVSTVQTQIAGLEGKGRMTRFDPEEFSLLVVDECHHSAAKSYRKVIEYYRQNPNLRVLGVTATPDRADKKALGRIFDTVAYEYGIRDGIDDGWLVPVEQRSVCVEGLDYSSIRTTAGDLNGRDLAEVLEYEENLHAIAHPTYELTAGRKSLVFAATVDQAERLTEILNRHEPGCAEYVTGKTPKEVRRDIFARYADKRFQFLVNVGVATEGFDDPGIECVVMARPTKSRSLYAQMAGRGTRTLTGLIDGIDDAGQRKVMIAGSEKPCVEIIDFVGNAGRHKLVNTADILGGDLSNDVLDMVKEKLKKSGKPADMMTELQKAELEMKKREERRREAANRRRVRAEAKYSTAKINPFDKYDITPAADEPRWFKGKPPTDKQKNFLRSRGIDTEGLTFAQAGQVCGRIINPPATDKQKNCLRRFGYDTEKMTLKQASKLITEIKNNGWRKLA